MNHGNLCVDCPILVGLDWVACISGFEVACLLGPGRTACMIGIEVTGCKLASSAGIAAHMCLGCDACQHALELSPAARLKLTSG